jgi:hypothetical protein
MGGLCSPPPAPSQSRGRGRDGVQKLAQYLPCQPAMGDQPSRSAPSEAFIQRLARQPKQARSHALIAGGLPQGGGHQGLFGLVQGVGGAPRPTDVGRAAPGWTTAPRSAGDARPRSRP